MKPPRAVVRYVSSQFGLPRGPVGRLVAFRLNKENAGRINACVDAIHCAPGMHVADIGFGGGIGLSKLLDRIGSRGQVTGVELSRTMLARAERIYRTALADGRLDLRPGSLTQLPLPDGSLDGAVSVNTIYFVPQALAAFRELARVLRSGAHLALGVADPDAMARLVLDPDVFILRPIAELPDEAAAASLRLVEDHRLGEDGLAYRVLEFVR